MTKTRKLKRNRPFWPPKYYRGLTQKQKEARKKEIQKYGALGWRSPKAYVGFKTDTLKKTKKSQYTAAWDKMYPGVKSLKDRAKVTGVPEDLLEESYNRGMAAWRTGHRPGATQQQWGYARVSSLLLLGKTAYVTDADLVKKAKERSKKAMAWFTRMEKESPVRFQEA
jgi:hypothetical protein